MDTLLFSIWRAVFHGDGKDFLEASKETKPESFMVTITERSGRK